MGRSIPFSLGEFLIEGPPLAKKRHYEARECLPVCCHSKCQLSLGI